MSNKRRRVARAYEGQGAGAVKINHSLLASIETLPLAWYLLALLHELFLRSSSCQSRPGEAGRQWRRRLTTSRWPCQSYMPTGVTKVEYFVMFIKGKFWSQLCTGYCEC